MIKESKWAIKMTVLVVTWATGVIDAMKKLNNINVLLVGRTK